MYEIDTVLIHHNLRIDNIKKNIPAMNMANKREQGNCYNQSHYSSLLVDSNINEIVAGLCHDCFRCLHNISEENVMIIINNIREMRTEINLSNNYRRDTIKLLCKFSQYNRSLA